MNGSRPSIDEYFLRMAKLVATRGTCSRRKVGCVLVDDMHHVLSTGYNGVPRGMPHCIDSPCAGAGRPSGTSLMECNALHAEWNALLQCRDTARIHTAYLTASPCVICMRMFCNTSVRRIVFLEEYPHPESKALAALASIDWVCHDSLPDR